MKPILVLYATREGQTRRIAEHIVSTLRAHSRQAESMDVAKLPPELELEAYAAVVLAASLHFGKHEREMVSFVREHRSALEKLPNVFLSTSMTEAGAELASHTPAERAQAHAEVERAIEEFFTTTGFRAQQHKAVAGALLYTQYNRLLRLVMKQISKSEGGSTDTSRDHEYTDWVDLDRFVVGLLSTSFLEPKQARS